MERFLRAGIVGWALLAGCASRDVRTSGSPPAPAPAAAAAPGTARSPLAGAPGAARRVEPVEPVEALLAEADRALAEAEPGDEDDPAR